MSNDQSPFVPGARVAVSLGRFGPKTYREDFVEKVHKTGRFTLRSNPKQQWNPYAFPRRDGPREWHAIQTGDGWDRGSLMIWDETTDAEISAAIAKDVRRLRLAIIQKRIEQLRAEDVSDDTLDQIEAALAIEPQVGAVGRQRYEVNKGPFSPPIRK